MLAQDMRLNLVEHMFITLALLMNTVVVDFHHRMAEMSTAAW